MKVGIEVEGRFKGLRTLFMDADEYYDFGQDIDIASLAHSHNVQQIYISDHKNEILETRTFHDDFWKPFVITLEVTDVKFYQDTSGVNILLLVENEAFWNLKRTDQVKFSKEHNVFAVAKESMYVTKPEDFAGDKEL